MKDPKKKTADNGKGDAPRNCFSDQYRSRYDEIFRKNKKNNPKENTPEK